MQSITVIVGLPGSGKTTMAKSIAHNLSFPLFDDFLTDPSVSTYLTESVRYGSSVVVTDPGLCIKSHRTRFISKMRDLNPNIHFEWVYFENDVETCIRNVKSRSDGTHVSEQFLIRFSKEYDIPFGQPLINCYGK